MDVSSATVFSVTDTELTQELAAMADTVFDTVESVSVDSGESITGDLCISVGGDGTYLEAIHRCGGRGIPVLGVHAGSLGFLSRVPPEDAPGAFESVARGTANVIERGRVAATTAAAFDAAGLNEVMVTPTPPEQAVDRKICSLHVYLSDTYVGQFNGSGLAVATPTGSTAVALSAGGPVHYPNDNFALQLTPLQTHNMGVRPVIFDGDAELRVYAESDVNVLVDGGRSMTTLPADTELTMSGAAHPARLVRTPADDSFFDALSGKLGWSLRDVDETGPYQLSRSDS